MLEVVVRGNGGESDAEHVLAAVLAELLRERGVPCELQLSRPREAAVLEYASLDSCLNHYRRLQQERSQGLVIRSETVKRTGRLAEAAIGNSPEEADRERLLDDRD